MLEVSGGESSFELSMNKPAMQRFFLLQTKTSLLQLSSVYQEQFGGRDAGFNSKTEQFWAFTEN